MLENYRCLCFLKLSFIFSFRGFFSLCLDGFSLHILIGLEIIAITAEYTIQPLDRLDLKFSTTYQPCVDERFHTVKREAQKLQFYHVIYITQNIIYVVSLKMTFYAEIAQMFFFLLCFYVSIINKIVCLSLLNSLTIEIYVFLHTYVFFYFCGLTVNKVAALARNSKIFSAHKLNLFLLSLWLNPRKCRSSRPEVMYIKYISKSSCLQIFFKVRSSEKCRKIFR